MTFVVLYDACVLYPAPLRDLFVRLAAAGIVRARWTAEILDECFEILTEESQRMASRMRSTSPVHCPFKRAVFHSGSAWGPGSLG